MKKGFTLTELLVVVLTIGVLAAVTLPKFNKVVETRRTTEAEEMLSSIRNEQEKRCSLDKPYTVNFKKVEELVGPAANASTLTKGHFAYELTAGGANASHAKGYTLSIPSYKDGRFCCEGDYCQNLNKHYPACNELKALSDYRAPEATCALGVLEVEPDPTPDPCAGKTCSGANTRPCQQEGYEGTETRDCSCGTWGGWDTSACRPKEVECPADKVSVDGVCKTPCGACGTGYNSLGFAYLEDTPGGKCCTQCIHEEEKPTVDACPGGYMTSSCECKKCTGTNMKPKTDGSGCECSVTNASCVAEGKKFVNYTDGSCGCKDCPSNTEVDPATGACRCSLTSASCVAEGKKFVNYADGSCGCKDCPSNTEVDPATGACRCSLTSASCTAQGKKFVNYTDGSCGCKDCPSNTEVNAGSGACECTLTSAACAEEGGKLASYRDGSCACIVSTSCKKNASECAPDGYLDVDSCSCQPCPTPEFQWAPDGAACVCKPDVK